MRKAFKFLLCLVLLVSFAVLAESESIPAPAPNFPDDGTIIKDDSNTTLGVSVIADPVPPENKDAPWSGSYVYFGSYDGRPIRFRVLAKDATDYTSAKALFLDSDESLFVDHFDHTEPFSGSWLDSDLRAVLNGPFLDGFAAPEQDAIAVSSGDGGRSWPEDAPEAHTYGAPAVVNDRVFLLDVSDVTNEAYGYALDRGWNIWVIPKCSVPNRVKGGMFNYWWLRSSAAEEDGCVGDVNCGGLLNLIGAEYYMGVAPALNIDQESIIFSSSAGTGPDEFKLTLADRGLEIAVQDSGNVSAEGITVTIPYEIKGMNAGPATQASVLVLDQEYTAGNTNGAGIIFFHPLGGMTETEGTFDLPVGCDPEGWGTGYYVYILAENRHGIYESDYASIPVPVKAPVR